MCALPCARSNIRNTSSSVRIEGAVYNMSPVSARSLNRFEVDWLRLTLSTTFFHRATSYFLGSPSCPFPFTNEMCGVCLFILRRSGGECFIAKDYVAGFDVLSGEKNHAIDGERTNFCCSQQKTGGTCAAQRLGELANVIKVVIATCLLSQAQPDFLAEHCSRLVVGCRLAEPSQNCPSSFIVIQMVRCSGRSEQSFRVESGLVVTLCRYEGKESQSIGSRVVVEAYLLEKIASCFKATRSEPNRFASAMRAKVS